MFESLLDNTRWVWENFGMQGVLVFLTLVVLYLYARKVAKDVEGRIKPICANIDALFARMGSRDVDYLVSISDLPRNYYIMHDLREVTILLEMAQNVRHRGLGYFTKKKYLDDLREQYNGIFELLGNKR